MPHYGIDCCDKSKEKNDEVDSMYSCQYLDYKLFSRHCDICKDLRLKIPAINSRYMQ